MNTKVYKWCVVDKCINTSIKTPNKLFVYVPNNKTMRYKWLRLARRDPTTLSINSPIYFCEDHFDLPKDMDNFMEYHVMGFVAQVRMKPGCIPTKFECHNEECEKNVDLSETSSASENGSSLIIKIDPKDLIDQVERRRPLYDPNHPDRDLIPDYRDVLWREICQTLVPNWSNQTTVEQNETVHELQKKWRNLKDCFRKDYRRSLIKDEGEKIKRKYKNYDRLKFLLPVIREQYKQVRKKKKIMIMTSNRKNLNYTDDNYDNVSDSESDESPYLKPDNIDSPKMDVVNEDKHFLLSLVPAFKHMDYEQKLTARIEILNVLRNIQCLNRSYLNGNSSLNGEESSTLSAATKVKIEHLEDLDNDTPS